MKRVAVQENLGTIKALLKDKGYEVVGFSDGGHVDAIVYTDDHNGIANLNNDSSEENIGAVLINASHKNIDEIEYIIEKRRYGSLFS